MPTPLYATAVVGCDIQPPRSLQTHGYRYTFYDTKKAVNFGHIDDGENSWTDGSESPVNLPLMIEATLVDDTNFNMHEWDVLNTQINTETSRISLNIILPTYVGTDSPFVLYVDSDGITYYDEALTSPAGGVAEFSDTVALSDSLDNYEYEVPKSDSVSIQDNLTNEILKLIVNFSDIVSINDNISIDSVVSLILQLSDIVTINDNYIVDSIVSLLIELSDIVQINDNYTVDDLISLVVELNDLVGISDNYTIEDIVSLVVELNDIVQITDFLLQEPANWTGDDAGVTTWIED